MTKEAIRAWLIERLAEELGINPSEIDPTSSFDALGLPSREAVTLSGDLEDWLARKLSPTVLWEYPTIDALASHLSECQGVEHATLAVVPPERSHDRHEPVAIVGIGLRFPGANSVDEFWSLLANNRDAIREVPADRWENAAVFDPTPGKPGKLYTRHGGFLDRVDLFDADFFGISPREAARMDPQQRLLMETAWEALEDAGVAPDALAGSRTGVFMGISTSDYSHLQYSDARLIDAYAGTGNAHSLAANRISYFLDLRGPSIAVDTACSSSLVAVHQAVVSLRTGECDLALAGGVNVILSPEVNMIFSHARMMSPDGRCKTFDASADGYVRGEGCGVVVLKRLSSALAEGDSIYAIVRGSAVNHDGRSNGLTAPNGLAQRDVIRLALDDAGVSPSEIGYVEAHGTGTSLGDPIEVDSLKAVLLPGRNESDRCVISSVKTNIGHLEAAAGIAGLIKAALVLRHGVIPANLHLRQVNSLIPIDGTPLVIPSQNTPWPAGGGRRLAGVSSFGFGGANAHVVLEESLPNSSPESDSSLERPLHVLAMSAHSEAALQSLAARYAERLENNRSSIADFCFSANTGRAKLEHRAAFAAESADELAAALREFANGGQPQGVVQGRVRRGDAPRIAFLFTGQGAQYAQMGRGLYQTQPTFRRVLNECDEVLRPRLSVPLLKVLFPLEGEPTPLDETAFTQPALFAIEYALAELWKSWGIEPACLMGHSVGEYVAACVSGVFSFEDGLRLVAERARLMHSMPTGGAMAAVLTDRAAVWTALDGFRDRVAIAAVNGPTNTVISGDGEAVDALIAHFRERGVKSVRLVVSHAFHSPLMDPILGDFERYASGFEFKPPRIPIASNVLGRVPGTEHRFDAKYWRTHLREAVQFADGIQCMADAGHDLFLEVGPNATLSGMGSRCLSKGAATWLPSLAKGRDDWSVILQSVQTLFARGAAIDWNGFDRDYTRNRVSLPTYPFERKRFWLDEATRKKPDEAGNGPQATAEPAQISRPEAFSQFNGHSDWLYRVGWIQRDLEVHESDADTGTWIIFADAGGVGDRLAKCAAGKHGTVLVHAGSEYRRIGPGLVQVRPEHPEDYAALLGDHRDVVRLVNLWPLDAPGNDSRETDSAGGARASACESTLFILQALVNAPSSGSRRGNGSPRRAVWCITRGAQAVCPGEDVAVLQAPVWGLGRCAAVEHGDVWGGLIDIETHEPDDSIHALYAELVSPDSENQIAYRSGCRLVARLQRCEDAVNGRQGRSTIDAIACVPDAAYLITGGLGGLGLQVAEWLCSRGARQLVLIGRSELPARGQWAEFTSNGPVGERIRAIQRIELLGATVGYESVDVADATEFSAFMDRLRKDAVVVRGVVHAAGTLADRAIHLLDSCSLVNVMRPKVDGAWRLHKAFEKAELDFFLMFSSAASVLGSPGQANYAAANAFMDALAHHRRARGLPALCVNWGPWAEVGMAARSEAANRLEAGGVGSIHPQEGLAVLEALMPVGSAQVAVINADWDRIGARLPALAHSPFVSEIFTGADSAAGPGAQESEPRSSSRSGIADIEAMEAYLRRQLAHVLHRDEESLPIDRNFGELGLDSIMMMEVMNSIERDLGLKLFPKELFDRPTIEELAPYLIGELAKLEAPVDAAPPAHGAARLRTPRVRLRKIGPAVRNRPAAFLLSSPRSGSTLLRVMLAGHPRLFCPPELHLLQFNSMREWRDGLGDTYLGEGLQRALMELHGLDADSARTVIDDYVAQDLPVEKVYALLQDAAASRLLIDKSPSYGSDLETLEHAERLFDGAKYIHLARHPYSTIESFVRNRFDRLVADGDGDAMALAEDVWAGHNANITDFLSQIDPRRHCLVKYEDLVSKPEETMKVLCAFLGVPFDEAVLKPYEGGRMTDGVHDNSAPIGDPNFLKRGQIDPALGEVWRRIRLPRRLGGFARRVAADLEYPLPLEIPGSGGAEAGVSSAVQHVVPIQPKGEKPPLFCCAPAGGMSYMYFNLAQFLGDDQPFYGLQDPALNPLVKPFPTMQTLCAEHVKVIKQIQPEGPYHLAGWSFGGAVAFETAQQLMAGGDEVAYLGIIDTEARIEANKMKTWGQRLRWLGGQAKMAVKVVGSWGPYARDFVYIILPSKLKTGKKAGTDEPSFWEYFTWVWADSIRHTLLKQADIANVVSRDSRVLLIRQPSTLRTMRVLRANLRALLAYDPQPYHGPITLLRAEDQSIMHKMHEDWTLGWGEVAKSGLDIIEVPGNHAVLLSKPYIETVGAVIREGLAKARARSAGETR